MKKVGYKLLLILLVFLIFFALKQSGYLDLLTLDYLKLNYESFKNLYQNQPVQTVSIFFIIYVLSTALSLPGALILTLAGGALFGLTMGTIIVSFASTLGASIAFLFARYLFRDWILLKFQKQMESINKGIEKEGHFFLFTLRLIPLFPFFIINLTMGLTKMNIWTYYWVSQIGMLAGTILYVNAGVELSKISTISDILSPSIIMSFTLLGLFPLLAKKIIHYFSLKKIYHPYKRPKIFDYNMVVIGGGSAGLVTSYICAAVKAKVAIIEKEKMGGDCLNTGCVPSKALIKSAKVIHFQKRAKEFGLESITVDFNFAQVMERVQRVIKKIEPHDSIERYSQLGVDCLVGEAKILSPFEVKVGDKIITTKNITIATGASPFVPPIPGLDKIKYLTSTNLWQLRTLPQKLIVLGGGPIGLEMAQSFSRFGSEVTLVEMLDRIMPIEDPIISEMITKKLKLEGIKILTSHKAVEVLQKDGKNALKVNFENKDFLLEFDEIIIAVGRKANVTGFGLEDLKINLRKNNTVEANDFLQTNFPNIFVCGDVTGPYQLTHTAAHQAWYCAVNGLFSPFKKFKVDYRVIPWCTYTDPEVATVGLNETMAKKQKIQYELTEYHINDLDRAITENEDSGIIRVLTVPGKDTILGATIVAFNASDLLVEFITAMKNGLGLNKILGTIHSYPTMSEANKFVAGNWKKNHAPQKILQILEKIHTYRRNH